MLKILKYFIVVLIVNFTFYIVHSEVFAKDFSSYYKTTYEFNNTGQAFVTQEISLVNETANMYISEYSLSLSGGEIENVEAFDNVGPLQIKTEKSGDKTSISLSFNDKVVGKGKILSFILKYKVDNLAKKSGTLWEVSIPKLGKPEDLDEYKLVLKIPVSFGNASSINPRPVSEEKTAKFLEMTFSKEALSDFGIIATFGQLQTYDFKISYSLKNDLSEPVKDNITLPSDTVYQSVFFEKINPEPEVVEIDKDGNWIASYFIPPETTLNIEAAGEATVFSKSKIDFTENSRGGDCCLAEKKYWEVSDSEIKSLAEKLKTPKAIFDYVVRTLTYDYSQKENITRKGALFALNNPGRSLCSEFTDLFIALCRSAGIPAREVVGVAFSDNPKNQGYSASSDILHAWPEYFDKEKREWIMVDPTFAKTSGGLDYFNQFDMQHFSLAVHGEDSVFPYPAGAWNETPKEKQIFVSVGKKSAETDRANLSLSNITTKKIRTLKNNEIVFEVKNISGSALTKKKISIEGNGEISPEEFLIESLPPFGVYQASFLIKPKETFGDYTSETHLLSGNDTIKFEFKILSSAFRLIILGCISLSALIVIILLSIRKHSGQVVKKNANRVK